MTHVSQIYRSRTYKVLESKKDMKYKTVVGVIQLATNVTAFVNTNTILILSFGEALQKSNLLVSYLQILEDETGITWEKLI